jgi:hypothetical protein
LLNFFLMSVVTNLIPHVAILLAVVGKERTRKGKRIVVHVTSTCVVRREGFTFLSDAGADSVLHKLREALLVRRELGEVGRH